MTMGVPVTITAEGAVEQERDMTMVLFTVPMLAIYGYPAVQHNSFVGSCYAALVIGMVGWVAMRLYDYGQSK